MLYLWSILSGLLLAISFPSYNIYWAAWIGFIPLFYVISTVSTPKVAARYAGITGLTFYGFTFLFLFSLWEFVGAFILIGWILLVLFYSLYTALFGYLAKRFSIAKFPYLLMPFFWIMIEWLRSVGPFGLVPSIGYSQVEVSSIIQLAKLAGILGVSFLVVAINALLAEILLGIQGRWVKSALLVLSCLMIFSAHRFGELQLEGTDKVNQSGKTITVALIQANFSQKQKLDYQNLPEIQRVHLEMTEKALRGKPDIIIWPETAIPFYLQDNIPLFIHLREIARKNSVLLVLGTPRHEGKTPYNSTMFISPDGVFIGWHDKHKLIPFGEYLPLRPLLIPILSKIPALKDSIFLEGDFSAGQETRPIETSFGKIGMGICSDSLFPEVFRKMRNDGADFFFTITNTAWFGHSSASEKLHAIDRVRAIENRRYVIQCTNVGITAIIDPWGNVVASLPPHERGILIGKIPLRK